MTNEQWEIVNELRMLALGHGGITCAKAANEIERLEQENKAYANHCEHLRDDLIRLAKENKRHQGYELGSPLSRGVDSD